MWWTFFLQNCIILFETGVKFYLIQLRFADVIAKYLGVSLFSGHTAVGLNIVA